MVEEKSNKELVEESKEQKELFLDIAAAYNNRMRPKRGTTNK